MSCRPDRTPSPSCVPTLPSVRGGGDAAGRGQVGRSGRRGERGGSVGIGYLLAMAVVLPLLFTVVQFSLWYTAKSALLASAQTAAGIDRAAASAGGITSGASVARQAGVHNVTLSETRTATTLTVTATGDADGVIRVRGLGTISQSVTAPVEKFR